MTGAKMADVKDCTGDLQNITAGVVPVDSGAPQPPARQHQPQGSPPPTALLKSPSATTPPGVRPVSHKGEGSAHNWPADSGNGLEDTGRDEFNTHPFDGNVLADTGKENAGGLPGGLSQKDRDERLRILRDRQNEERQKKLEELKQQALAAQKFREQKEEERRRRIEQLRERDEGRRQQVEERKRQIWEAERDRREAILRKNQTVEKIVPTLRSKSACNRANTEREARIEAKRKNERSSIVFAFGSSTPRMLEPADTGGTFWGSRRATSTTNVMFSSMVGSTGGSSGGGDKTTSSSGLGTSQGGVPTTSSTSLSRRSSERELVGGVMATSGAPAGSKKRAVSAHALDRKPGDELRSSTSMYEVFCWSDLESGVAEGKPSNKSTEPKQVLSSPVVAPQDVLIPFDPSNSALGYGTAASCLTHPLKDGVPERNAKLAPFGPNEKVSSSRRTSRSLGTDLWVGQEAVSAGGMIFKGEETDGPSRTSPFSSYGPSPRARKKTDLMPTIPSPRGSGGDGLHHKGRHKSPGRAFSMTRLDQLARPRTYPHPTENSATPNNDIHHHHLVRRTSRDLGTRHTIGVPDRSVSKSTSHLAVVGSGSGQKQAPQERPLRRSDASRSMSHLGAVPSQGAMPPLVPRLTRAERLRRRAREVGAAAAMAATGKVTPPGVARSGDVTPSSPSRPLSALSVHSAAGSGVSFRHRPHLPLSPASHVTPLASPTSAPYTRKPRPVSIAITGVSHESAVSPVGSRDIRSSSKLSSDNRSRAQSAADKEAISKPPKVPSAKKSAPKSGDTPTKKSTPAAIEKLQAAKSAAKTSPKASPIHSPGEPVQQDAVTAPEEDEEQKEIQEGSIKSSMERSTDGMEKQDEMKPVDGEAEEGILNGEKEVVEEEKDIETKTKEEMAKKEKKNEEVKQLIEDTTEEKEPDKGVQESSQDVDMTASMIARTRITTEEEAKAALAERRRLAREQAEREAELERLRLEEERRREEERQRLEEEEQRRAEAEQLRLLEEASRLEKERLMQAIEEAQKREREEALKREEEAKARAEKEEQEKKAREEAERLRQEMEERLKKEEEERQMRRKRVEAIMLRTRAKAATPTLTPTKGGDEKEDSPSEERKESREQQSSQASEEEQKMVLESESGSHQEMTGGGSTSSSAPTTTEGSPSNQGTSPGHQVSTRNDTENAINSSANLLIGVNEMDPLQQAMLNNNGGEITRPVEQTNGHRNGIDFGPTSAFTNVDDVLNNTANNLLDLSEFDSLGGVHLQQTQQLSGGGSNAFSYTKQLSHEDTVNSNAHAPPSSMGASLQPSIPSAPLQTVTGELDTIIPTGSPFQVEDSLSSAKRQDKNAAVGDLLS